MLDRLYCRFLIDYRFLEQFLNKFAFKLFRSAFMALVCISSVVFFRCHFVAVVAVADINRGKMFSYNIDLNIVPI